MRHDLSGRTVVLTGAAGGIGSELARQLAARGSNLVLVDVRGDPLRALASVLGSKCLALEADVTDLTRMQQVARTAVERFGAIDVVVANAGTISLQSSQVIAPVDFDRVIEVDLLGTWRTIRASLPAVIAAHGCLLFVSSLAGKVQGPIYASYNASKAATRALANTLRLELQGLGTDIGVALLMYTDTETARLAVEHCVRTLPGFRQMRPRPVAATASDLVRAIERRSRRVFIPRAGRLMMVAPDFLQKRLEGLARRKGWAEAIRDAGPAP